MFRFGLAVAYEESNQTIPDLSRDQIYGSLRPTNLPHPTIPRVSASISGRPDSINGVSNEEGVPGFSAWETAFKKSAFPCSSE